MDKIDIRTPVKPKPAKTDSLPKNAHERAVALIGLMGRLADHIDKESEAIRLHRPIAEIRALVKAKEPMALVYEEVSRLLRVDTEGLAALPDDIKRQLKQATERLRDAGTANSDTLRVAQNTQRLLVDTLTVAVNRAQTRNASAYAATAGGGSRPARGYGPPPGYVRPAAATLDTQI